MCTFLPLYPFSCFDIIMWTSLPWNLNMTLYSNHLSACFETRTQFGAYCLQMCTTVRTEVKPNQPIPTQLLPHSISPLLSIDCASFLNEVAFIIFPQRLCTDRSITLDFFKRQLPLLSIAVFFALLRQRQLFHIMHHSVPRDRFF